MKLEGKILLAILIIAAILGSGCISDEKQKENVKTNVTISPHATVTTQVPQLSVELAPQKQEVPISWDIGNCGYGNALHVKLTNLQNKTVIVKVETVAGTYQTELSPSGKPESIKSGQVQFAWQSGNAKSDVKIYANNVLVYEEEIEKDCSSGGSSGRSGLKRVDPSKTPMPNPTDTPMPTATVTSVPLPNPTDTPKIDPSPSPTPTPTPALPVDEFCEL